MLVCAVLASCLDPNVQLQQKVSNEPVPTELYQLAGNAGELERFAHAYGFGVSPAGTPPDSKHGILLAQSAAQENARANLIERLRGLLVRSDLMVRELIERKGLQGLEEQLASQIKILQTRRGPDGIQVCLARISLHQFLDELAKASNLQIRIRPRYDPSSYLSYPVAQDMYSRASLREAIALTIGDSNKPAAGPPPIWRVPGVPRKKKPKPPVEKKQQPGKKKQQPDKKKQPPAKKQQKLAKKIQKPAKKQQKPGKKQQKPAKKQQKPAKKQQPPDKKKQPDKKQPQKPDSAVLLQFSRWPVSGLLWRHSATVDWPTRFLAARPTKSVKKRARPGNVVRVVVLLPTPLMDGQQLIETLPAGSKLTGQLWSNGPARNSRVIRAGQRLTVRSDSATCVVYELSGLKLTSAKIRGQVQSRAGHTLYKIAAGSGSPPAPPAPDRKSPRFLIASPPNNQLLGSKVKRIVVSGTVTDRSGLRDLQAGRTMNNLKRPGGRPAFPSRTFPRVVPFQLVLPLVKGKNQLILVAEDALGNLSAIRIVVFRQ